MAERNEREFMVFLSEGSTGVGAVRKVRSDSLVIYVENGGEFVVPLNAISSVHDGKVVLARDRLDAELLRAIRHEHDREDPNVAG